MIKKPLYGYCDVHSKECEYLTSPYHFVWEKLYHIVNARPLFLYKLDLL